MAAAPSATPQNAAGPYRSGTASIRNANGMQYNSRWATT
jgi:hypothetical protein